MLRKLAATCVVVAAVGCRGGAEERARAMGSLWISAARVETCPRPALRSPTTGDATAVLAAVHARTSPATPCLKRAAELHVKLGSDKPIATFDGYDDLRTACAPLYAAIVEVAHATSACSPFNLDEDPHRVDFPGMDVIAIATAVSIQVAPLVRRGELAQAARHLIDAVRFADDFGRKATLVGAMLAKSAVRQHTGPLLEVLADPRLTAGEARAIARDLEALLASAPRFDAVMRQETAWLAAFIEQRGDVDLATELDSAGERVRAVEAACCDSLRACADQLDAADVGAPFRVGDFVRGFAERDYYLTVARMQAELAIAGCGDVRTTLAPWTSPDRAVLDGLTVSPPAWQRVAGAPDDPMKARTLRCR